MIFNFTGVQGMTIPEGVVTKITDSAGRVLWQAGDKVILEVAKITADTYASEVTYTDEQFILLDIYPKTNGTVKVTYGGLTKTITDTSGEANPNAQEVFFGTFNGASDSVTTPASGELTIEGSYRSFAVGVYSQSAKSTNYCGCITDVVDWGGITSIGDYAFYGCTNLALSSLPSGITSIGDYAFYGCTNLALSSLPSGITSIGDYTFYGCTNLALSSLPSGITSIGGSAFRNCTNLALSSLPSGITSIADYTFASSGISEFTLHDGVTTIGKNAFEYCYSMKRFVVPASVTSIGYYALFLYNANTGRPSDNSDCEFYFYGSTPPTFGDEKVTSVINANDYTCYVPVGCGTAYTNAGFKYVVEAL